MAALTKKHSLSPASKSNEKKQKKQRLDMKKEERPENKVDEQPANDQKQGENDYSQDFHSKRWPKIECTADATASTEAGWTRLALAWAICDKQYTEASMYLAGDGDDDGGDEDELEEKRSRAGAARSFAAHCATALALGICPCSKPGCARSWLHYMDNRCLTRMAYTEFAEDELKNHLVDVVNNLYDYPNSLVQVLVKYVWRRVSSGDSKDEQEQEKKDPWEEEEDAEFYQWGAEQKKRLLARFPTATAYDAELVLRHRLFNHMDREVLEYANKFYRSDEPNYKSDLERDTSEPYMHFPFCNF